MSSAGKLFYILFEDIMLIINIDQADLHYRWCAKVFLFSDGGKTGEVKLSFLGDDGECPSSVVDRKNLKMG